MRDIQITDAASLNPPVYDRSDLERIFLPVGQMLQLDRVCAIQAGQIVAETDVRQHWVFPMHFPGDPIFPGTLLIEGAGQTVATWAWHMGFRGRPRLLRVFSKFDHPVLPEDHAIRFDAVVRQKRNVFPGKVEVFAHSRRVAVVELVVMILSPQPTLPGIAD
jgi:3-hydroxymyristoyl/3-hydroxydecanoyl-(acyl carrier protein) dehydratase